MHFKIGGSVGFFEFRPKGEHVVFSFVFIGGGIGYSFLAGSGGAPFPKPHLFVADVGRVVSNAFRETLGGSQSDKQMQDFDYESSFVDIEPASPFSAVDLNRAFGRLTSATAAFAIGYGAGYISAYKGLQVLFDGQSTAGVGAEVGGTVGTGLGANVNVGMWIATEGL